MDKWTQQLTSHLDRIQQRLQTLLESESGEKLNPSMTPFEPTHNPRMVAGIAEGLPADVVDRAVVVFSRLAGMFDVGVLLEREGQGWIPRAQFSQGNVKPSPGDICLLKLPDVGPLAVLTTPAKPLLKKMGMEKLDGENKFSAALVRPVPEFSYILFSKLPDLWLKDHLAHVAQSLAAGFAE